MSDTMNLKVVLSAVDKGVKSTLKGVLSTADTLGSKFKSGLGIGIMQGIGQSMFFSLQNGARGLLYEMNLASAAWKTFEGNIAILGKTKQETKAAQNAMQEYANKTIYSASDMANTYSQLAAVGIKNTDKLVTGFGGLAGAAEDPAQAMKTLSQQATQMAAKPNVAWEDFKLMLEQTPAGIAAVAKEMGMTTSELVTAVQDGTVKTNDFFAAVEKVGNSKGFQNQAMQYKTASQALDGLKETLSGKLMPAFNVLSNVAIKGIEGIIGKIDKINADKLAEKVSAGIKQAKPYWDAFKTVLGVVGKALAKFGKFLLDNSKTIGKALPYVLGLAVGFKTLKVVNSFSGPLKTVCTALSNLANGGIKTLAAKLFGVAAGEKAAGTASVESAGSIMAAAKSFLVMSAAVLLIAAGFALLAFSAISLANAGGLAIGVMAGLVIGVAALGLGMGLLLKFLAPMSAQLMPAATAMLALGAAVVLVAAGFAILAFTAISLANTGGLAIGVMVGLVAVVALLAVGAAALAPALTAGAVGLIAFGVAMLLVGTGALLASVGIALIASQLPVIATYGLQGALAITVLGASLIIFAAGATLAGAAAMILGAGLIVAAAGIVVMGAATLVAAAGILALAVGVILLGVSLGITAGSLMLLAGVLPSVASGAMLASGAFALLAGTTLLLMGALVGLSVPMLLIGVAALAAMAGIMAFGIGMLISAAGALVMVAGLTAVASRLKSINSSAKSAQSSLKAMQNSVKVVENGLSALGSKAKSSLSKLTSAFNNSARKAKTAGQKVGKGFTSGVQSGLAKAPSAASKCVSSTISKLRGGKSKAYSAGANISKGFARGMLSCLGTIQSAASRMAEAADKAVRAKAKIKSPSRVFAQLGSYVGQGFADGISSMSGAIKDATYEMISIPQVATPNLAMAYNGAISSDYDYYRNSQINIEVPLNVDGKEFARANATYMQNELNKQQIRNNRKKGQV